MSEAKECLDCFRLRPLEVFQKTRGGVGRADRCWDCLNKQTLLYREAAQLEAEQKDAELTEHLTRYPSRPVPEHLWETRARWERGTPLPRKPRPRSNRPHMAVCWGCGDTLPKVDLFEYRGGGRSHYCKPCMKRRAVERECGHCGATRLTSEFFDGRRGASPFQNCLQCREKLSTERRCPRCETVKPAADFRGSGHCRDCRSAGQRERRARAREARS